MVKRQAGDALRLACLAAMSLSLFGCTLFHGERHVPDASIPETFLNDIRRQAPAVDVSDMLPEWWLLFRSQELSRIIDLALERNHDIRIAVLRLEQGRARSGVAVADRFPTLSAPLQAGIDSPEDGLGSVPEGSQPKSERTYRIGARLDWRLDLWGEKSAEAEAARRRLWQAAFTLEDTQRTVVADVVNTWLGYLSLNDRIHLTTQTEKTLSSLLDAVKQRKDVGDASGIELQQQQAAVNTVRATVPALELERAQLVHRLARLTGTTPDRLKLLGGRLSDLDIPNHIPSVPPSILLLRPDIKAAEAGLLAAEADIDVARARILPSVDLTAGGGTGVRTLGALFEPHTILWNVAANLTGVIFDYGKRSNQSDLAQAQHGELVEAYLRSVLEGVRDIEDSLAGVYFGGLRIASQTLAKEASRKAWEFSQISYSVGATDYMTLLDTERTFRRDQDEYHRARLSLAQSVVNLFSSLGGGVQVGGEQASLVRKKQNRLPGLMLDADQNRSFSGDFIRLSGFYEEAGLKALWKRLLGKNIFDPKMVHLWPEQAGLLKSQSKTLRWFRVHIGPFEKKEDYKKVRKQLELLGLRLKR